MKDGAHTHHDHGQSGVGVAVLIALILVIASGAASIISAVVHVLIITGSVLAGLTVLAVIAFAAVTWHRREHQAAGSGYRPGLRPAAVQGRLNSQHEVAALRGQLAELHEQVAMLQRADSHALAERHQHLHFHGLDAAQAGAVLRRNISAQNGGGMSASRGGSGADEDGASPRDVTHPIAPVEAPYVADGHELETGA
jgi:hypothetical protein